MRAHEPFTDTAGLPISVPGYQKNAAEFPVQCRVCLEAWPCAMARLSASLTRTTEALTRLNDQLAETHTEQTPQLAD